MKFGRAQAEAKIQADMTPMIDVVFQLLIFFLCNLQYRTLEGRLEAYLPKSAGLRNSSGEQAALEVVIRVVEPGERKDPLDSTLPWSGSGPYELTGRRVSYQVGPRRSADLEPVERWLERLRRELPDRPLRIDARPGTIYDDVVPVLDAAFAAGFDGVSFVGPLVTRHGPPRK